VKTTTASESLDHLAFAVTDGVALRAWADHSPRLASTTRCHDRKRQPLVATARPRWRRNRAGRATPPLTKPFTKDGNQLTESPVVLGDTVNQWIRDPDLRARINGSSRLELQPPPNWPEPPQAGVIPLGRNQRLRLTLTFLEWTRRHHQLC